MDFYFKYVAPKEKLVIDNKNDDVLVLDKNLIKVFQEKKDFPKEMPKPISLCELTNYYNIVWKGKGKFINKIAN